jgi:hypothetical protein
MAFTGDIRMMGQLATNLGKLGTVPSRAAREVADGIAELILDEFETGRDPYGREWKELTEATLEGRSQTTEPPLTDYGDMRRSVSVKPRAGQPANLRGVRGVLPPTSPLTRKAHDVEQEAGLHHNLVLLAMLSESLNLKFSNETHGP